MIGKLIPYNFSGSKISNLTNIRVISQVGIMSVGRDFRVGDINSPDAEPYFLVWIEAPGAFGGAHILTDGEEFYYAATSSIDDSQTDIHAIIDAAKAIHWIVGADVWVIASFSINTWNEIGLGLDSIAKAILKLVIEDYTNGL
jgi:hypothetical protein